MRNVRNNVVRLPAGLHGRPLKRMPTLGELEQIPRADTGEYELNEYETGRVRRLIYGINKDGIRKFRTMREGTILRVWRIK